MSLALKSTKSPLEFNWLGICESNKSNHGQKQHCTPLLYKWKLLGSTNNMVRALVDKTEKFVKHAPWYARPEFRALVRNSGTSSGSFKNHAELFSSQDGLIVLTRAPALACLISTCSMGWGYLQHCWLGAGQRWQRVHEDGSSLEEGTKRYKSQIGECTSRGLASRTLRLQSKQQWKWYKWCNVDREKPCTKSIHLPGVLKYPI